MKQPSKKISFRSPNMPLYHPYNFEEIDDKIRMAKLAKAKKAKAQQLARAKQGFYNRVFGDM